MERVTNQQAENDRLASAIPLRQPTASNYAVKSAHLTALGPVSPSRAVTRRGTDTTAATITTTTPVSTKNHTLRSGSHDPVILPVETNTNITTKDKHGGGLIGRLLRRTGNSNSSVKNRLKVVEVRSHRLLRLSTDSPSTSGSRSGMGNVHQGSPVVENNSQSSSMAFSKSSTDTQSRSGTTTAHAISPLPNNTNSSMGSNNSSLTTNHHHHHHHNHNQNPTLPPHGSNILNGGLNKKPPSPDRLPSDPVTTEQLCAMVDRLKSTVRARDYRIQELEREVDKLRSVLDQQMSTSWLHCNPIQGPNRTVAMGTSTAPSTAKTGDAIGYKNVSSESDSPNNHPSTLPDVDENTDMTEPCEMTSESISTPPPPPSSTVPPTQSTPPLPLASTPPPAALLLHKRLGVSGEPMRTTQELKYHEKDARSRQQIREALRSNDLLMNLDAVQLQEMVSCMHEQTIPAGCHIICEGDDGTHLYVGADGEYEVSKSNRRLCVMQAGCCFGELALLYNCKRTASVKALVQSRVWVLDRSCFQTIMMKTGMERIEERKAFLRSVSLFKELPAHRILRIADSLEAQYHASGDCIIRQGELADSFFIIQSGEVNVTITTASISSIEGSGEPVEHNVRQMAKGEYFGEKALLMEGRRTANVYALGPNGVEVLCLYRKDFLELIGDIQELKNRPYVENEGLTSPIKKPTSSSMSNSESIKTSFTGSTTHDGLGRNSPDGPLNARPLVSNIRLTDLEHVCVLGVGGFGRVDLVTLAYDRSQAFAMKRMQKHHILQTRQQEHVHLEKIILSSVSSPFICRLYATYRDNKYIYMLLEACLGGELWTILRDSHHLDDRTTKFCLSCCIESLDYLHRHGIIYRDLKPENMLITAKGYIKMCDFGFAKYIGVGNKTWTFCGTPEYVAPEVILNKGHDFAADYWSLGILTFELLTGTPPFQASEPIKIYMKTLKGIDALGLAQNKYISLKALQFIRRLCRFNPSERLGIGKHGIQEIRSHKYFQGFDWAAITKQTLPTPFKVKLNGPLDYSNFDRFTMDEQEPQDEMSGWDANF